MKALWVAGDFPHTNRMLDLCRSSGYYAGVARATQGRQPERFGFKGEATRIRKSVWAEARARSMPPVEASVAIFFRLVSSRPLDADAWYLVGKPALDGLVDAKVIPSDRDRSYVAWVGGTCVSEPEEVRAGVVVAGYRFTGRPGLLIELIGPGLPHAY